MAEQRACQTLSRASRCFCCGLGDRQFLAHLAGTDGLWPVKQRVLSRSAANQDASLDTMRSSVPLGAPLGDTGGAAEEK